MSADLNMNRPLLPYESPHVIPLEFDLTRNLPATKKEEEEEK